MGIHTTLDTSGNPYTEKEPFYSKWLELMKYTDLILLDIKHIDEQEHIKLTGQTNKKYSGYGRKVIGYGKTGMDPSCTGSGGATVMITCTGWQILFTR